jgi:hypothetical protein
LKAIGLYSFTYDTGIEIIAINYGSDDYAHFRWLESDGTKSKIIKAKIHYDEHENATFQTRGYTIPFRDIIPINGGEQ